MSKRRLRLETLERRDLLAAAPLEALEALEAAADVNGDGRTDMEDVGAVFGAMVVSGARADFDPSDYDVTGDGLLTPEDVRAVFANAIAALNAAPVTHPVAAAQLEQVAERLQSALSEAVAEAEPTLAALEVPAELAESLAAEMLAEGEPDPMQELQIQIEVRFVTIDDQFFRELGLNIDLRDHSYRRQLFVRLNEQPPLVGQPLDSSQFPSPDDFNLEFDQDSFVTGVPAFGQFDSAAAANVGFAILSDIEAFFLLAVVQNEQRSNVLPSSQVTVVNGQVAGADGQPIVPLLD